LCFSQAAGRYFLLILPVLLRLLAELALGEMRLDGCDFEGMPRELDLGEAKVNSSSESL
jgi:hypothetical protein